MLIGVDTLLGQDIPDFHRFIGRPRAQNIWFNSIQIDRDDRIGVTTWSEFLETVTTSYLVWLLVLLDFLVVDFDLSAEDHSGFQDIDDV